MKLRSLLFCLSLIVTSFNSMGPTFADDGDAAASDRFGNFSFANGSEATSTGAVIPTTGNTSVEAWVNPNTWATRGSTVDNYLTVFSQGQIGGGCDANRFFFGLHRFDNTKYQVHLGIDGASGNCGPVNTFPTAIFINPSEWTHLAVVVNRVSSSYQIYVNGELLENVSVSLPATANSSFVIGGTSSSTEHGFTGAIDQVKVWNVALTQAQVRSSRLATDNAGISGIVAIYDFNEQLDGSNLIDRARTDTNNQALTRTNVTRTTKTSPSISITTSTGTYFASNTITASTNSSGSVTFKSGGTTISGCSNIATSGSGSSHSATCTWTPSAVGTSSITVDFTPVLTSFLSWSYGAGATNLTINRASQSITLSSIGTTSKSFPYSQALSITTSGTSGSGARSFSVADGTATGCTLSSSSSTTPTLTASTSGTCLVTATIAQDTNYNSATSSGVTFTFSRAAQSSLTITSTSAVYGTPLQLLTSGGTGTGAITFAVSAGTTTCSISGDSLTASSTGTCLVTATKAQDANYTAISSSQSTVTFAQGSSTSSLSIAAGTLIFRTAKTLTITGSTTGRASLKANNVFIPGCRALVLNAANSYSRTCSYRPMNRGFVVITGIFTPTDSSFNGSTVVSERLFVNSRSLAR